MRSSARLVLLVLLAFGLVGVGALPSTAAAAAVSVATAPTAPTPHLAAGLLPAADPVPMGDVVPMADPPPRYTPLAPARLADTRADQQTVDSAGPKGAAGSDSTIELLVAGRGGVPASGAAAVAVNLTTVAPSDGTFVTAFPTGAFRPLASTVNSSAGATMSNMAIVKLGTGGKISLYNAKGSVHLIVDVLGWFPAGAYGPLQPSRIVDTRANYPTIDLTGPKGALGPGSSVQVQVSGRADVPLSGVAAVAVNITAVSPTENTYISAFPTGSFPNASTVNPRAGQTVSNSAIVKLGTGGKISLYNAKGSTHLAVDILGWFPTGDPYGPLEPARLADTRPDQPTIDGTGPKGAVGPGVTVEVQAAGRSGIPAGAAAVAVNITAITPTDNTFITAHPAGGTRPTASTLNPPAGRTVSNMAIVKLGDGKLSLYNAKGSTHLIVDVLGWFPEPPLAPSITAGGTHSCVLLTGGTVKCWGGNDKGQLGDGTTNSRTTATPVTGLTGVVSISAGSQHTCAVLAGGTAKCWGYNGLGRLGNGTTTNSSTPVTVTGLTGAISISAGGQHTCALLAGGTAKCWGANGVGQLGNGTKTNSFTPVTVTGLTGATSIFASIEDHTCALISNGTAKCWGYNEWGELGDGTKTDRTTPTPVTGLTGATSITAGYSHTCVLVTGGAAKCWGSNSLLGQLGDGSGVDSASPVAVSGLTGASAVSGNHIHTCTVVVGGTAKCWGGNGGGQLGDGSTTKRPTPVAVVALSGATSIAAGGSHSCALLAGGGAKCWGTNSAGQLGDGSYSSKTFPVTVQGL